MTSPAASAPNVVPAIAVFPGTAGSVHLTELPPPTPGAGQALVRVRRVGVCGTDQEIIDAKFGSAPAGATELVLGHELLGEVAALGPGATGVAVGDLVTATVRRPDGCPSCLAGQPDMCSWLRYTERGIIGAHGFMAERILEEVENLVPVPPELAATGVLVEPTSVVEKAWRHANLIQRRLAAWAPATAVVLGAGPIGLLGTLLLRAHGLRVVTVARRPGPHAASAIIEGVGASYVSTRETPLAEVAAGLPPIDLIFEASGAAALAFEGMRVLGANGVLVLLSLTGGGETAPVPVAEVNRGLVLGNKVVVGSVNSAKEDFAAGVASLGRFERLWPGLTERLITHRLSGYDEYGRISGGIEGGIKTVIEFR